MSTPNEMDDMLEYLSSRCLWMTIINIYRCSMVRLIVDKIKQINLLFEKVHFTGEQI